MLSIQKTNAQIDTCHNDIACFPEWTTESKGIVRLLVDGNAFCINNLFVKKCILHNSKPKNSIHKYIGIKNVKI